MNKKINGLIRFESYKIDPNRWTLHWRDEPVVLNRKSFDLLLFLIEHRDRVVGKAELLRALWPDQYVEESNLTQHVFLLRKALARHDAGRKIIETITGRGYRFTAPVEVETRGALEPVALDPLQQIVVNSTTSITKITIEEEEIETDEDAPVPLELPGTTTQALNPVGGRYPLARAVRSRAVRSRAVRWLALAAAAVVGLATFLIARKNDPARIRIATYKQITTDGRAKALGGTDGSRLYFTQLETSGIAEISVAGGVQALLPVAVKEPWSGDVSPDGSTLLIVSQAGGQGPASSLWSLRLVGGTLRWLGDAVISAAWSPDGESIAYTSANGELFVMRRDGSGAKHIASPGGYLQSLAWSPNRPAIRFSKDGLLWEIALDGTNLHQLLPGWGKTPTQWSGEWAADGRYYFVAEGQIWVLPEPHGLERVFGFGRAPSPQPIELTFGPTVWDSPVSSPDAKKIFASGRTRRGELVRFDPQSRLFRPFLGGISAEFVSFSGDGKSVAYVSFPDGILWRANADGSHPVQLTEPPVAPKSIRWSPDGSQIAFVNHTASANRNEAGIDAIFVLPADGSGSPQRLLPSDLETEIDPSWSPDGRKIAFATSPNVGVSSHSDLRIFDLATRTATLLPGSEGLAVPRWSPDGRFIAAMTLDTVSLKLFNPATGKWTRLDTGAVAFPEWSHDSQWIYYVRWSANPALLRIRAADGRRETIADLKDGRYTGSYTLWMALDPADAPMMLRDEGSDDIYALTLAH